MIKEPLKVILFGVTGLIVLITVALGLLAGRLSHHPLSLSFLVPPLQFAIRTIEPSLDIRIEKLELAWPEWPRGARLTAYDISFADERGGLTGALAKAELTVDADRLRDRLVVFREIAIINPRVVVDMAVRSLARQGRPSPVSSGADVRSLLELLTDPNLSSTRWGGWGVVWQKVSVGDTLVTVRGADDEVLHIAIGEADLVPDEQGLVLSAILKGGADNAAFVAEISGHYLRSIDQIELVADLTALRPAALAAVHQALATIDVPLSGEIAAHLDGNGELLSASSALEGGKGFLDITEPAARLLGAAEAAQRLPVLAFQMAADFDGSSSTVTISRLSANFARGTLVAIPPPISHKFPLQALVASGRWMGDRLEVTKVDVDLGGPTLSLAAKVDGLGTAPRGELNATFRNIPMDDFARYWPSTLAPEGLSWCQEHLSAGRIETANIEVIVTQGAESLQVKSFRGDMSASGGRVDYLPPLPPVESARATAEISLDRLTLRNISGETNGLRIGNGTIIINGLDTAVQSMTIDLGIDGPVANALEILSREPLEYTANWGIKPGSVSGTAHTQLSLTLPLVDELEFEDINLLITSDVRELAIQDGPAGLSAREGFFDLRVDNDGVDISGRGILQGIAIKQLTWAESFAMESDPRVRAHLVTEPTRARQVSDLAGEQVLQFFRSGTIVGNVDYVERPLSQRVTANFDLSRADLTINELMWNKPVGVAGRADFVLEFLGSRLDNIPAVAISAPGIEVAASALLDDGGKVAWLDISRFVSPGTDLKATVARRADVWDVVVNGDSVNLQYWLRDTVQGTGGVDGRGVEHGSTHRPAFRIAADLNRVHLGDDRDLREVSATAVYEQAAWKLVQVNGTFTNGGSLLVSLLPEDNHNSRLSVQVDNAGETLDALGVVPHLRGGNLHIDGVIDGGLQPRPLSGLMRLSHFRVVRAPLLARMLGLLSLQGLADGLRGTGIPFSTMRVPFDLRDGELSLDQAVAFGSSLGLTGTGDLSFNRSALDLQGTISPFYFLNALLGRLPLVGWLFGDADGGGLFAAGYRISGPLDNPNVAVNPVTLIMPGFTRTILAWLESILLPQPATNP